MKIRIIKESILDEAKEDDVKEKYGLEDGKQPNSDYTYPHFAYREIVAWVNYDRSKRIKFLDWMAKQVAGTEPNDQEALKLGVDMGAFLTKFIKRQDQMKEKDINKYPDFETLKAAYKTDVLDPIVAKARKGRAKPGEEHGDLVYEDDRFFVVHPKTLKASCYYGAKTKWCISQKDNKHYDSYTKAGKVFYFIRDDTKKNNDDFYALAVQYNKYTGERELLWDREDNSYGPDDWPVDAYGEESEEPIMGAIQKHFEHNYKDVERTLETLNHEINNEAFDIEGVTYSNFVSYDVLFESRIFPMGGGLQQLRFAAEYYIYYTPQPSIRTQFKKTGFKEPEGSAKIASAIQRAFEEKKKKLLKDMFNRFPQQDYDVEVLVMQNQINITSQERFSSTDVGNTLQWIMSARDGAQHTVLDITEAFVAAWEHQVLGLDYWQTINESKKQIKVKIK